MKGWPIGNFKPWLGRRLMIARREAGLTQHKAAVALRVRQTWVSKCELGQRRMGFFEVVRFSRLYRKPLRFFDIP